MFSKPPNPLGGVKKKFKRFRLDVIFLTPNSGEEKASALKK